MKLLFPGSEVLRFLGSRVSPASQVLRARITVTSGSNLLERIRVRFRVNGSRDHVSTSLIDIQHPVSRLQECPDTMEPLTTRETMFSQAGVMDQIAGNWTAIVSLVLILLVLVGIGQRIQAWYRLRHFKGPWSAALSRIWIIRHSMGGRLHWDLAEVTDKYGTVQRERCWCYAARSDFKQGRLRGLAPSNC